MRSQNFKSVYVALAATGIIFTASCNKTQLMPSSDNGSTLSAQERQAESATISNLMVPYTITSYNPVYGISSAANTLYSVDPATGNQTSLGFMTFGGGTEITSGLSGIALSTNTSTPNRYVVTSTNNNPCLGGSGTTFFSGTLPSPSLVRLGTLLGRSIKDIEYNPVDGFLYGVEGNTIVKILSLGVGCGSGTSAVAPVVVTLGTIPTAEIKAGPYSIAFNWAGQCNIVAAKEKYRAIIDLNAMIVNSSTVYKGSPANMVDPQEIGFCISKMSLLVATNDKPTPTTTDLSYYIFGTSSSGVVGSWLEKSNNCLVDYTSKPQSNTVEPK